MDTRYPHKKLVAVVTQLDHAPLSVEKAAQ